MPYWLLHSAVLVLSIMHSGMLAVSAYAICNSLSVCGFMNVCVSINLGWYQQVSCWEMQNGIHKANLSLIRTTAQRQHYSHLAQPLSVSVFHCLLSHFPLYPLFLLAFLHTSFLSKWRTKHIFKPGFTVMDRKIRSRKKGHRAGEKDDQFFFHETVKVQMEVQNFTHMKRDTGGRKSTELTFRISSHCCTECKMHWSLDYMKVCVLYKAQKHKADGFRRLSCIHPLCLTCLSLSFWLTLSPCLTLLIFFWSLFPPHTPQFLSQPALPLCHLALGASHRDGITQTLLSASSASLLVSFVSLDLIPFSAQAHYSYLHLLSDATWLSLSRSLFVSVPIFASIYLHLIAVARTQSVTSSFPTLLLPLSYPSFLPPFFCLFLPCHFILLVFFSSLFSTFSHFLFSSSPSPLFSSRFSSSFMPSCSSFALLSGSFFCSLFIFFFILPSSTLFSFSHFLYGCHPQTSPLSLLLLPSFLLLYCLLLFSFSPSLPSSPFFSSWFSLFLLSLCSSFVVYTSLLSRPFHSSPVLFLHFPFLSALVHYCLLWLPLLFSPQIFPPHTHLLFSPLFFSFLLASSFLLSPCTLFSHLFKPALWSFCMTASLSLSLLMLLPS